MTLYAIGSLCLLVVAAIATPGVTDGTGLEPATLAQTPGIREFTISARRYEFSPRLIEVDRGDIVKITLVAEDTVHGFAIDEYRISKRFSPGRNVTFEFCALQPGRFVFYCNLTGEEGCREMRGELVVR